MRLNITIYGTVLKTKSVEKNGANNHRLEASWDYNAKNQVT